MKFATSLFSCTVISGHAAFAGKNTIASAHPLESMEFLLRYLPVAVAEDNGVGDEGHGAIQGRTQTLKASSYDAPNCQLFSVQNKLSSSSGDQSMHPSSTDQTKSVGNACTYHSDESYGTTNAMWKVYAHNEVQCCNACVSTKGCAAATFTTSSDDHSGGFGPQSWEGFGIHLPNVLKAKTTGGITVDELEAKYAARLGDHSKFDAFMDYSASFYTYDLQHYVDLFTADKVPHFLGQWKDSENRQWYSMIFLVPQSAYVIELISTHLSVATTLPEMEQRMSDALCSRWVDGKKHANNAIEAVSVNRAATDMDAIENAYGTLMSLKSSHEIDTAQLKRKCYATSTTWDVCFTKRAETTSNDEIFSVKDHEDNLWAIHAGTMGDDPTVTDKMTDSHNNFQVSTTALKSYFNKYSFATLLKNRLAYACSQSYVIDPTGFSIQTSGPGGSSFPGCSGAVVV